MKALPFTILASVIILAWTSGSQLQAQQTPGSGSTGGTNSGPTGAYPGTGSSLTNSATPGQTPGQSSTGDTHTPPSGVVPGSGAGH